MNIFVLFGITGDLARNKVIPTLSRLENVGDFLFIGAGRKTTPPEEFNNFQNKLYISGSIDDIKLFKKIAIEVEKNIKERLKAKKSLGKGKVKIRINMYSSLPPELHLSVVEKYIKAFDLLSKKIIRSNEKRLSVITTITLEKPIGSNFKDAKKIVLELGNLKTKYPDFRILFADHYLHKEAILDLERLHLSNRNFLLQTMPISQIAEIKVLLYEKDGIRNRGSFYDKVGALYDVGQNHLLQILSTVGIMLNEEGVLSAKNKANFIQNLQMYGTPHFWQYQGYTSETGVEHDSLTETFFSASFTLKGSKNKTIYTISSGKCLETNSSGVEITFIDKRVKPIFIDLRKSQNDAYYNLFNHLSFSDLVSFSPLGSATDKSKSLSIPLFVSEAEVLASWKLVERLKKFKSKANLVVYKKSHGII